MKNFLTFLVLLVLVETYTVQGNETLDVHPEPLYLEGLVNKTFNQLIEDQIKPRDPLHLDQIDTDILGNRVLAEDITVEGFSNMYFSHIKLSGLISPKLAGTLEIPRVTSYVEHLEVELDDGTVGHGSASILMENLRIHITAKVNIRHFTLTNVKVRPFLERGKVTVTGDDDEEVLQEITNLLEYFLNYTLNNDVDLHDKISNIIQEIINNH